MTQHPEDRSGKSSKADDGSPKFGRLLIILIAAVMLVVGITLASEAFYS